MLVYESSLVVGHSNSEITKSAMEDLCDTYYLLNLIKDPTCFKNPDKPSCIDLTLTKIPKSFVKLKILEIGLSEFNELALLLLKHMTSNTSQEL